MSRETFKVVDIRTGKQYNASTSESNNEELTIHLPLDNLYGWNYRPHVITKRENFISLSEFRNQQIDKLLDK